MAGYICKSCKFRTEKKMRECPWCGKNTIEAEKSAGELLNEINDILQE